MNNDKIKIRQLLKKFMDGTTSVDEEQEIALWFRNHPTVSDDLEDYRAMFAWFDDGMPLDDNNIDDNINVKKSQEASEKHSNRRWLYIGITIAASVALLVGLFLPRGNEQDTATQQLAVRTIQRDSAKTETPIINDNNESKSDTINFNINNNDKKAGGKRRRSRVKFEPVLPPPLYTQADTAVSSAEGEPVIANVDDIDKEEAIDEATANKIIDNMLASMEKEEQLQLKLINLLNIAQSQEIMATLDDDNTY